ncbi:hypothetical protein DL98DRAFT_431022 [Cadophora sp. DSE1049]|nr:hypothetical protein DL98DRAFT_431022 [Cadophora sp. DSE1049]
MPPQQCTYCPRSFNRAEHLLRHIRSHTKEKPFKCGACGKGYAREYDKRIHVYEDLCC